MAIPDAFARNFDTLLRAAADGALALLECRDATTGVERYVICAVGHDGGDFLLTPFGHLCDGDPYDAYVPPGTGLTSRAPVRDPSSPIIAAERALGAELPPGSPDG